MRIELKISYAGTEPGLNENRLSLSSFGPSLALLLKALQRTASAIVTQALDDPEYGRKGGKLAGDAKLLDLELERLEEGSTVPVFICSTRTSTPGQVPMPFQLMGSDLAQTAVVRLLEDIEAESTGRLRNQGVRKYLESLPAGVTKQRYCAFGDGALLKEIGFMRSTLPKIPTPLPRLIPTTGTVVGVGFEPGLPFIKIKPIKGAPVTYSSTSQQVDAAISLRGRQVIAAVMTGESPRLIWIRADDQAWTPPSLEETTQRAHILWGNTLKGLAK